MIKSSLCNCDDCGKVIELMDYWNQDGVCVTCFKGWMDEVDASTTK